MLIFDASTLILLARIELLEIVFTGFSSDVAIPAEVERECCGAKKTLDALLIQRALDGSKIRVVKVKDARFVARLKEDFRLGQGEAEAIALAVIAGAQLVGIDDKNGINACKLLGLAFATGAGFLVAAFEKNLVTRKDALLKLERLAKFGRYRTSIIEDVRSKLEAGR
jgi:predicted nucleic acid-binding protein